MIKKILYTLLSFFVVLMIAIVVAANSSFVIKKVVDLFAPEYKISYDDISGNILTGVKISALKFDKKLLSKKITFSWNPSKLLYKRVAINEVSVKALDVNVLKALIASFPSEDNSSTEALPLVILVDKVHIDLHAFEEQGILISKTVLDLKELIYTDEKVSVDRLSLLIDSNISRLEFSGDITNNRLLGDMIMTPKDALFRHYDLPVRKEAIDTISVKIDANEERVIAHVKAKAKQILLVDTNKSDANVTKDFNVDIDSLLSHVVYSIKKNSLVAKSTVIASTPYAQDITLSNTFIMDKNMRYSGELNIAQFIGIDSKIEGLLKNLTMTYKGDLNTVDTYVSSDGLKGSFKSSDLKKGHLHLETTEAIKLDKMLPLPEELNGSKVNLTIDVPLDFEKIMPLKAKAKIRSNISNIDAEISYDERITVKVINTIPQDSLLKHFDDNVKWNAISPMVIDVDLDKNELKLNLKSKALSSDIKYRLENGKLEGNIRLGGLLADIKGFSKEKIIMHAKVNSMDVLMKSIASLYAIEELPPVSGSLNLSAEILALKHVDLSLSSSQIVYKMSRGNEAVIENLKVLLSADASKVELKSYQLMYDEMKIFSTKPSLVSIKEDAIEISELWLNDQIKIVGTYNTKTKKGKLLADANNLRIEHKMIDLNSEIQIQTVLDGNKTSVEGKILLLGGDIHYDLSTKTYPSDSDIVIVQDMKKKEASPFMENLSTQIIVQSKKPLVYKQGPIDIRMNVDLSIHKSEHDDLMVLGDVVILQGGSYTFEGKKFVLEKSNIYFTGNPSLPLVDMSVKYHALKHLITIGISGSAATPNITFSSSPSLSREQILSVILFDSADGAGTNSGEDMMKMMGGAMAKSALSDMGIKLDHLAIGSNGSVEVGKKITDKITFIYVNDDIPQVRVKYQHSARWESVISADEISQAYDIVYKKEYRSEDFIFSK